MATNENDDGDFGPSFCNQKVSYFVGVDADEEHPQRLMFGDDNFEINGTAVPSGVAQILTNVSIAWGPGRHEQIVRQSFLVENKALIGNLGLADGSVQEINTALELQ